MILYQVLYICELNYFSRLSCKRYFHDLSFIDVDTKSETGNIHFPCNKTCNSHGKTRIQIYLTPNLFILYSILHNIFENHGTLKIYIICRIQKFIYNSPMLRNKLSPFKSICKEISLQIALFNPFHL